MDLDIRKRHMETFSVSNFDKKYNFIKKVGAGAYAQVNKVKHTLVRNNESITVFRAVKVPTEPSQSVKLRKTQFPDPLTVPVIAEINVLRELGKHQKEFQELLINQLFNPSKYPIKSILEQQCTKYGAINIVYLHDIVLCYQTQPSSSVHIPRPFIRLVYEYAQLSLGSVLKLCRKKKMQLADSHIKALIYQLLLGLCFLNENWVIHRDIKPDNILLVAHGVQKGVVKLADFGLARILQNPEGKLPTHVVTLWYRSPELLLGSRHYFHAIDVWSLGCIFGELLDRTQSSITNHFPVEGTPCKPITQSGRSEKIYIEKDQMSLLFKLLGFPKISSDKTTKPHQLWPSCQQLPHWGAVEEIRQRIIEERFSVGTYSFRSQPSYQLLQKMLYFDPKARITPKSALKDPYFSGMTIQNSISQVSEMIDSLKVRLPSLFD